MIPYGRQEIGEHDVQAVLDILRSDWLTQGPAIERFEQGVARYCGVRHAVAVSSGTAALHLACLATGLQAGDSLWTSPNTFVASANCGRYCGAAVDFVDIDPGDWNLSPELLEAKLAQAALRGALPKVLVPVHFAGLSCDMARIGELARRYGISVIEDACHSSGAEHRGAKVGACAHSDMTVFSFHPVKLITTGEGGMVLTNREDLYRRLLRLRSHGITRDPGEMADPSHGPWYYQQVELGFNYRMTDIQAALGASQLERLDEFVARRNQLADRYDAALAGLPLQLPSRPRTAGERSACHLYVVKLDAEKTAKKRKLVFEALRAAGIQANVHYIPVHTQPYYRKLGFREGDFPNAERYYEGAITLPLYPRLTEKEQDFVVAALKDALR